MVNDCIKSINLVFECCNVIDELVNNEGVIPPFCPMLREVKENKLDVKNIWLNDVINFLSAISLADGYIDDTELNLLREVFNMPNFNRFDVKKIVDSIPSEWFELPMILRLSVEVDISLAILNNEFDDTMHFSKGTLLALAILGNKMIEVDGDYSDVNVFNRIIDEWTRNMDTLIELKLKDLARVL